MITEETLAELERLSARCDPAPWTAVVEGRDAESGDSFIRTGTPDRPGEDLYVTRDSGPAEADYLDLIAAARTWLPALVAEARALRPTGSPTNALRLSFTEAELEALSAPEPYDVLLGANARVRLESGGVVVYREELFPIAELALALQDWLRHGLSNGTDFVFDSVEHDEPGLVWCRYDGDGWKVGSIHADAADPVVHSSEDAAEAFGGFVESVRWWIRTRTGRHLDALRPTELSGIREVDLAAARPVSPGPQDGPAAEDCGAHEPELLLPDDFDDHGWEVEAKGCYLAAPVRWSGRDVLVDFYDPFRLAQDIETDLGESGRVELGRVVVLPRLSREAMRSAARALPPSFFDASGR